MSADQRPFSAWTHKMAYAQAFTRSSLPVDNRHRGSASRLSRLISHRSDGPAAGGHRAER